MSRYGSHSAIEVDLRSASEEIRAGLMDLTDEEYKTLRDCTARMLRIVRTAQRRRREKERFSVVTMFDRMFAAFPKGRTE